MKKFLISTFLFTAMSTSGFAGNFVFNYKNLNTLAGLICKTGEDGSLANNEIFTHKIEIEKIQTGSKASDTTYEISGTCNAVVNTKAKEVSSFGDELSLQINLKKLSASKGTLGLNKVSLKFAKKNISSFIIEDGLTLEKRKFSLTKKGWAKNNNLFSFNGKGLIQVSLGRSIAAFEKNNALTIKGQQSTSFYNIWSYNSVGCTTNGKGQKQVSQAECETYSQEL